MKQKYLILSGSGAKIPFFAGAYKRLYEEGLRPQEVVGTSGGAIIATAIALGWTPDRIIEMCIEVLPKLSGMIDFSLFRLLTDWGFISAKNIEQELDKHFPKVMGDVKIPLHITTVNFDTEETVIFNSKDHAMHDLIRVIRASISIPIVFTPVSIGKDLYIDGGVQRNFAIDLFGNTKDSIGLYFSEKSGRKPRPKGIKALGGYVSRILDMLIGAKTKDDIEDAPRATVIPLRSNISSLDFSLKEEEIKKMIKSGYDQVDKWLKENSSR